MAFHKRAKRSLLTLILWWIAAVSLAAPPQKTPEFVPGSWTLVLLPDTQFYSEKYPGLFTLQTHWIVKNKDKYNIRYVIIGTLERRDYHINEILFQQHLKPAFQQGQVVIYEVP